MANGNNDYSGLIALSVVLGLVATALSTVAAIITLAILHEDIPGSLVGIGAAAVAGLAARPFNGPSGGNGIPKTPEPPRIQEAH